MPKRKVSPHLQVDGDIDLEQFIADMVVGAQRIVASARSQGDARIDRQLEQLLGFMRNDCKAHFAECFESRGWPTTETLQMLEDWGLQEQVGETNTQSLLQKVEQVFHETY